MLRFASVLMLAAAMGLTACGNGRTPAKTGARTPASSTTVSAPACKEPVSEALDPASGRHLLPGQPDPTYRTDPPTSGPHRTGIAPTGVLPDPIPKPVQVGMLEAGQVIIQHTNLEEDDFGRVTALATESVTVAPSTDLPGKIVATAWQVKLICSQVDEAALRSFVTTFLKPENAH